MLKYKLKNVKRISVMLNIGFIESLKKVNLKEKLPEYNFLDVIKKTDNENVISEWLAFLLDAKKCGSAIPLKRFCEFLGVDLVDGETKIEREYTLDNRRRIDIIIKLKSDWVVIENKINSMECNEQTVDYEDKISSEIYGQDVALHYVYLKPAYNASKPANQKFKIMTYGELAKIWENISLKDFIKKDVYIYFSEFMKLISGRYAMNSELQFDENTKLYIEYREQFNAAEKSFDNACQTVKQKLLNVLGTVFPDNEGWVISSHTEYIQFYKTNWGFDLHFEIGTWAWQRNFKNISFNRLIAKTVEITYCLHAERQQADIYGAVFKDIENQYSRLFCTERYDFSNEDNCIFSLNAVAERLTAIKNSVAQTVDGLIMKDNK